MPQYSDKKSHRCRPPYIAWSDSTLTEFKSWLKSNYPEFLFKD